MSIAARVSVSVPIWLGLMRMALAMCRSIASRKILVLVTNTSSPTSWMLAAERARELAQPSQSASLMPSSMVMIG